MMEELFLKLKKRMMRTKIWMRYEEEESEERKNNINITMGLMKVFSGSEICNGFERKNLWNRCIDER
jgi:hypothetical protein